jgi:hypothetical protein
MNETMTKPQIVSASNAEELPFLDLDGSEVIQLTPESIVKSGSTTLVRSDSNSRQSQNPNGSLSHNNSKAVHKIIITPPQHDRSEKIFLRSPTRDPRLFESIDDESILQTNITIPDIYYPNSNTISQIDNPSPGPLPELDSKDISFQQIISNNIFIEKEQDGKFPIDPTKIPTDDSNLIEKKEIFWGPQENPNWSHYKGGVKNGLLEGSGVLIYRDGSVYTGSFCGNAREGVNGVMNFSKGFHLRYSGSWVGDKFGGVGELEYSNGDFYSGNFFNGERSGKGKMGYKDCGWKSYDGDFYLGLKHGEGVEVYCNEENYSGEFRSNKKDGSGVYTFANGDVYSGNFENEMKCGDGK